MSNFFPYSEHNPKHIAYFSRIGIKFVHMLLQQLDLLKVLYSVSAASIDYNFL